MVAINIPSQPRITGNLERDLPILINYLQSVANSFNALSAAVEALNQLPDDFDASSLIDPASATAATAQKTANDAFTLASSNKARLDALIEINNMTGTADVSGGSDAGSVTFAEELDDADYEVVLQPVAITGAPDPDAFLVIDITPASTGFDFTVHTAPGASTSVTFQWWLRRDVGED